MPSAIADSATVRPRFGVIVFICLGTARRSFFARTVSTTTLITNECTLEGELVKVDRSRARMEFNCSEPKSPGRLSRGADLGPGSLEGRCPSIAPDWVKLSGLALTSVGLHLTG